MKRAKRCAVYAPADSVTDNPRDKVVFILDFFEELRRIAPPLKK